MKKKGIVKTSLLGYIFIFIVSFIYGLINTKFEFSGGLSTIIVLLALVIFVMFISFTGKYTLKTLVTIVILLGGTCVIYVTTKETVFLIMIMVAIITSELNYTSIFKMIFYERLIMLAVIIMMSFIGVLSINEISWIKGGTTDITTGYGLGFNHPNQLAYNIGFLILVYLCYKNEKLKQYNILVVLFAGILGYIITKSRTLLILLFFSLFLIEIYKGKKTQKFFKKIFIGWKGALWVMPICALAALGLPILMSTATGHLKTILYAFNGLIGSRFTHSSRVLELYPVTLFGGITDFDLLQTNFGYSVVDNGYLRLLYNFGVLGFILFFLLYFITINKLIEKEKSIYLIAIIVISLWGITENVLRSFAINFTVVFWAECINYLNIAEKRKRGLRPKRKVRIHI